VYARKVIGLKYKYGTPPSMQPVNKLFPL